jgi:EmrB/QacA subfamily drug resistance transporter
MELREAPRASPRLVALIVACGLFMEQLDGTILSTSLPAMARSLNADPLHMSTALTAYLLSLAVFTPVSGQVADRFGSRTVFCATIVIFMAGSALCGLATGLGTLIPARILQGIGGALMVPVGRLVLLRAVPRQELVSAIAWMLVPGMIGPVLGPPVGGLITTYLNWRWIFYVNIPVGFIGLGFVLRYIEETKEPGKVRFDILGTILSGASLCCLMFGLETLSRGQISPTSGAALLGTGVVCAALYARHARRHAAPVLDFGLMRIPTFAASVISGSLFRIAFGSVPFLLPLLMQIGFGVSAAASGAITFTAAAGSMLMKATARPMLRILGFRRTFTVVGLVSAVLLASFGLFRPAWPLPAIYAVLLACGFISSLNFTAYNTIAYADLSARQMSGATSFYSTFQQFSLTLGIAISAAFLSVLDKLGGHDLPDFHDFTLTFLLMGCIAALSVPVTARLPADAGAELSGQRA